MFFFIGNDEVVAHKDHHGGSAKLAGYLPKPQLSAVMPVPDPASVIELLW